MSGGVVVCSLGDTDRVLSLLICKRSDRPRSVPLSDSHGLSSAVFGPKLGMRSMVLARYSWGSVLLADETGEKLISPPDTMVPSFPVPSLSSRCKDTLSSTASSEGRLLLACRPA